ncbi:histidine phosphatase family protein [Photobacterium kasasachensis]|uniref:histidine phosphatase family protein n=1 Tax=Photobacterium kasasachensis TaxID=2910240 RepID=UPI003D0D114E
MKTLIVVRHAERPEIKPTEVGNHVLLTEKGKQDTAEFASQIAGPVVSVKSSPIGRCLEMAEIIAKVHGYPVDDIEHSRLLGDPGFIIENGKAAWQQWQTKGHATVNEHLLSASSPMPGFAEFGPAVQSFLQQVRVSLSSADVGYHVWVTHDVMLATLASRVMPTPLSISRWPSFLGHLAITLSDNDELLFRYSQEPFGS